MEGQRQKSWISRQLHNFGAFMLTPNTGETKEVKTEITRKGPSNYYYGDYQGGGFLFNHSFDGEKNFGEMGPIKNYFLNHEALRMRSWQLYLDSEIAQTVLKKFTTWIIGSGLRLQCEPDKLLLQEEGVKIDTEKFNNSVEARWCSWADSNTASHSGMMNLHTIAQEAHKNAIVGGDGLVILRFDEATQSVTVQLIDGCHVQSPVPGSEFYPAFLGNGNRLVNGIELDANGQHIAFWVRKKLPEFGFERVDARNSMGMVTAFMVYGNRFRLDNERGMPLIACVMESMKKMDRYKEATLASAEERAKIVLYVKHDINATGENPFMKQFATINDADASGGQVDPRDITGRKLADQVAATENKSTYNLPVGSDLKSLDTKNDLYFKDFYSAHIDLICATVEIPPDVAMSQYNNSFSASRAATKDWEHTIGVKRDDWYHQFYKHIYHFWFIANSFQLKINAPGFLLAYFKKNNNTLVYGYLKARFTGSMFPHIDPLKEANAERVKMGSSGAHLPFTNLERSTEVLQGGDSDSNLRQFAEELASAKALGIVPPVKAITKPANKEE